MKFCSIVKVKSRSWNYRYETQQENGAEPMARHIAKIANMAERLKKKDHLKQKKC